MKIESTDQDIRTLLSSAYYRIPRFQRPYSWDRENIQEFWDDVVQDKAADYFIGSMVIYREGSQRFGIVDGQQRLTTITILLCVLRNCLGKHGFADLARGIHGLIERPNRDNKLEFILATESSYPFFQDHIQSWDKPEVPVAPLREEETLQNAYEQLGKLVEGVVSSVERDTRLNDEARRTELQKRLIGIRDALLDLKLIAVKLDDEDDAYIIFETLNTRGKDLSLTDLVKNHITKHLRGKNESVDPPKVKWQKLQETIQGAAIDLDTDSFIHHYWLSKYDYLPAKRLFKVLKKRVTKAKSKALLDALLSDAALYRSIHETSYGKWTKQEQRIEEALRALMLFKVRQQTPCVLSLIREYRSGKIKMKHLQDALIAIEKFHFLFTAVTSQRSSGGISKMYAALGRRLFEAADTDAAVRVITDLKVKLRERMPLLGEVRALFPTLIYTANVTKQRKLVKYALTRFSEGKPTALAVDYDQTTIEHLVPQSAIGTKGLTDTIVGQLGNLVLVSKELNKQLRDKPFDEKKPLLIRAGYDLPDEIRGLEDITKEDIEERTKRMAEQAYNQIWRI